MWISKLRKVFVLGVLTAILSGSSRHTAETKAAGPTLVITMDYAGGLLPYNAAWHPYLRIYSNGAVTVTSPVNGAQTHARLTAAQLNDLLAFVTVRNQFLTLSTAQIANAIAAQNPMFVIGDGTTTSITLSTKKGPHTVSVYAADTYFGVYPTIKPLAEFIAIEQRLQQIANTAK
jgi:hypothetical protein